MFKMNNLFFYCLFKCRSRTYPIKYIGNKAVLKKLPISLFILLTENSFHLFQIS